jgi:O-antigen ligase
MHPSTSIDWWRPEAIAPAQPEVRSGAAPAAHGRFAFLALMAFTFVLVLAPQDWLPALAPLRLAFVAALAAAAAHLIDRWRRPVPWATPPEFVLAGLLLGWAVVTVPLSMWPGGSVAHLTDLYLKSLIVFWLLGRVIDRVDRLYGLAWLLSLASVPIAVIGLMKYRAGEFIAGSQRLEGYGSGMTGNPNDLALTLTLFLPLTLAVLASTRSFVGRAIAAASAVLAVACIVVTFSRGGFIALAVVLLLGMAWFVQRWPLLALAGATAIALVVPALLPSGYAERVQTAFNVQDDRTGSAQERLRDMKAAGRWIQEHPIVGAGVGMDILALNEERGATWRSVHDVYLQYGVDLGIIGIALFALLLGSALRTAWRTERRARAPGMNSRLGPLAAGIRISLTAFTIAAFFYPVAYYFYFYYLAGLAVSLRTISRSVQP